MVARMRILSLLIIIALLTAVFPLISQPTPAAAADDWASIMPSGSIEHLRGIWANSPSDVFAVGAAGSITHYNGSTWSAMTSNTPYPLYCVWGSSGSDVYAVGGASGASVIMHYDGSIWAQITNSGDEILRGIWGSSANDIYAVGDGGLILHYNGIAWAHENPFAYSALAVWGSSASDVWIVCHSGRILHSDGTTWSSVVSGTSEDLCAIWGRSGNDIFAVGDNGTILHYNGTSWSAMTSGILTNLFGVWGSSGSNVFAVGSNGIPLRYNGSTWSAMTCDTSVPLYGVGGTCSTDVYAVGVSGTIVHYGSGCGSKTASIGTNLGAVNFTIDYGAISNLRNLKVANTKCATPAGYDFPYNLFSFNISNLTPGQTVQVTIKFPRYLPTNVKYYKCVNGKMVDCTRLMTRLNGYTLVLSLTDGGLGDADGLANGTIVDPGGPAEQVAASQVYGQGTIPAVTQQAPVALPAISVKSASLSATKVTPGTPVTVTADVANTGTSNGTTSIKVYVNGQEESSQGVTVSSGSITPLTFTVSRNEPGTYTVYVGGTNAGSFTVDWLADSNIIIISVIAILFAFAIGVIYMTRRKQAH